MPSTVSRRAVARFAVAAAALGLGACEPVYTNHGFTPQLQQLETVSAGLDTRSSVLAKLGQPSASGAFDSANWYYVASRMQKNLFYAPEVVERTVVAIRFDEAGLVERVDRFALEDGRVIDLKTETTPTYGRELTVLQQLFGNIGRVDPGQVLGN
jgi:outer membrane protein assembly factor BamE (lipoprotein component of BamABCDE complex)